MSRFPFRALAPLMVVLLLVDEARTAPPTNTDRWTEVRGIDAPGTALQIFALGVMTVLPLVFALTAPQRPTYAWENPLLVGVSSVPAVIGWPLFLIEFGEGRKRSLPHASPPPEGDAP